MPQLIYDVQFKIDQSSLAPLKGIIDASTTNEVTKLSEKIEELESQLARLKTQQNNVSKSAKGIVKASKDKRAEVARDIQLGKMKGKVDEELANRLRENISLLEGSAQANLEASLSDKRSATSKTALSNEFRNASLAIEKAKEVLEEYEQQQDKTNQTVQGGAKSFSIANQTLFGFGDLAQDATQFSQGFAQGMRAIGNNIAFNSEMFGTLVQKTGGAKQAFKALGSQLLGTGGIILGINVAVMAVTTIMTQLGKKTKETQDAFSEFTKAIVDLKKVSGDDFLGIDALENEKKEVESLRNVVSGLIDEEEKLVEQSKRYSSYVDSEGKRALTSFREENKTLLDIGLKPLDERLEELNEKIRQNSDLLKLSPLAIFRNEVSQSADSLKNQFTAGLFESSDSLETMADTIKETISQLRSNDANLIKSLGLDSPDQVANLINFLKQQLSGLEDLFPPDKPVIENIIPEDVIIEEDLSKLESFLSESVASMKSDMDTLFKKPFSGSIAAEQEELSRLQQVFNQVTNEQERDRLRIQIENQQARIKAMRDGLAEEMTLQDLTGDFDPFNIDIVGEEGLLSDQAKEQQDALNQVMKDGLQQRLAFINAEVEATKIAEKSKQMSRELGAQGAQAVSQLLQNLFGESKAIAIAETLVSTYFSAQKAYASQLTVPTPDAIVRARVAAGIALAQGLARVAAIRKTNVSSSGGSGSSSTASKSGGGSGIISSGSATQTDRNISFLPARGGEFSGAEITIINTFDEEKVSEVAERGTRKRQMQQVVVS